MSAFRLSADAIDNSLSITTERASTAHPGEFSSAAHVNSSEVGSPDLRRRINSGDQDAFGEHAIACRNILK